MSKDRFWLLLSRHLAGEASPEEEQELKNFLETSPENKLRYDALLKLWGRSKQQQALDVEHAYQKVISQIQPLQKRETQSRKFITSWVVRIAAVLLIGFGISLYFFSRSNQTVWDSLTYQVKENAKGERSKITLSDGTTVWLNADSKLSYPAEFAADTREVYLIGEAFFDVTKNSSRPFIIHLKEGDVRVLGTSFNIKAFDDEPVVETSVVTGKVAFIPIEKRAVEKDTVLLTPNFKVVYTKKFKRVSKEKTNGAEDKAWVEGKLVFKSMRFADIGKVLERTYGKRVIFDNTDLKNCRLTGTFQNNSLEEVMSLFAETKDYTYSITGSELHVRGTGCFE
jgi:ferric-dicitrate binding protein FerR (iron transport regulator)